VTTEYRHLRLYNLVATSRTCHLWNPLSRLLEHAHDNRYIDTLLKQEIWCRSRDRQEAMAKNRITESPTNNFQKISSRTSRHFLNTISGFCPIWEMCESVVLQQYNQGQSSSYPDSTWEPLHYLCACYRNLRCKYIVDRGKHHKLTEFLIFYLILKQTKNKLHGLSPRANYTERATAACRRSDCQLLRIKGATWSA
jgi:hypothetical protein